MQVCTESPKSLKAATATAATTKGPTTPSTTRAPTAPTVHKKKKKKKKKKKEKTTTKKKNWGIRICKSATHVMAQGHARVHLEIQAPSSKPHVAAVRIIKIANVGPSRDLTLLFSP